MTTEEYQRALAKAEVLMRIDPEPDSLYGKRLIALVDAIQEYEREHFPDLFFNGGQHENS